MRDGGLQEGFFSRSLCEPWPDSRDVQNAQILEQYASAEAQALDDEVIKEVVGGFGKVGSQSRWYRGGIFDDYWYRCNNAG